jgi:Flp pilus assembly protein TadB
MRLRDRMSRRERRLIASDAPLALDLLAGALRAGAPPGRAAHTVGAALRGPVGEALSVVARELDDGASPEQAWAALAHLPCGQRLARAVARSADSGAALAAAFTRLAQEQRDVTSAGAQARAARVGVLMALPLGLCFLPAFLLAGVVPVVAAVLGQVLSNR